MLYSSMGSCFQVALFFLMSSLASFGIAAETITLGGVGSLTPIVKLLGAEYVKKNPGVEISVIEPPMGTGGGIRALAAGKVDVALSGRLLKADETGQAKPWLQTPMVLATSGGAKNGVTRAEVAEIYAGRKTSWSDNKPIRLVLRGDKETETAALRSMSPAVDAAVSDALNRPGLPIAENDLDALDVLTKISGSLGSTTLGLVMATGAKLAVLPLDGVAPSIKTMEDGSYRLLRPYFVVTAPNPRPSVSAFVTWLNSPAAISITRKLGYMPLK
jgi:phosphate transport system substrate-binding protein